jgi:hypothetical protein
MKFNKIWQQLIAKKPSLSDPDAVVRVKSKDLYHLLSQVYLQGGKDMRAQKETNDILKTMFGGR